MTDGTREVGEDGEGLASRWYVFILLLHIFPLYSSAFACV